MKNIRIYIEQLESEKVKLEKELVTVGRINPDNVQEFKVTTSNPTSEEGRNSGANVSIATR